MAKKETTTPAMPALPMLKTVEQMSRIKPVPPSGGRRGGEKETMKGAQHMKFKVCPYCGSNLDPSERCDCQQERRNEQEEQSAERRKEEKANGKIRGYRA
ncbi:hypothetical protein [Anaerotruncus rubiinfantis]|uniref:hypothetical protein n=1 Tax=Anaerotruncus rubiinfantis TaxID=1720200 RepID=UPI00189C476E|nr:hypothetical protein [Anaerotruncus rubiinfantis]